ncbi:MAG: hypothetical protein OEV78_12990 [Spirochaetia bacterium]|nr:hypothetical protein [Spirochaetia bacterium]
MIEKKLGKITNIKFGIGGYQDAMLGLHYSFSGDGWSADSSESAWDCELIKWSINCKWSESDRDKQYTDIMRSVSKLLKQAKVDSVDKLKNIPVEVLFENYALKSWRILEEVL